MSSELFVVGLSWRTAPVAVREQLANGLYNRPNDARAEDERRWREALQEEKRALAGARPEDAAVRELSEKFENWYTESFRLSEDQIQA